jgi:L-lactate permease
VIWLMVATGVCWIEIGNTYSVAFGALGNGTVVSGQYQHVPLAEVY